MRTVTRMCACYAYVRVLRVCSRATRTDCLAYLQCRVRTELEAVEVDVHQRRVYNWVNVPSAVLAAGVRGLCDNTVICRRDIAGSQTRIYFITNKLDRKINNNK